MYEGPLPELIRDNIMVTWVDLDEGWNGDFDSENPDDEPLLRFDVYQRINETSDWEPVDDSSYCTATSLNEVDEKILIKLLEIIMDEVEYPLSEGTSIKKICERLSHINPSWII